MSPPGRPKGEIRSAQHEGDPMSPPGRPKGEIRSAQHEGDPMSPPGRPKGEIRSAQHEVTPMQPRRWWPYPWLSALQAAAWLLLQQSLALPQLITATVLGWGLPRLLPGFLGPPARVYAWGALLRLLVVVLCDIVVSNFVVARLVLWPGAKPQPLWVPVTLEITHPLGIALFASIITMTPGTVSCVVDEAGRRILVHALDGSDPAAMATQMKQRYEQPLMEILEP